MFKRTLAVISLVGFAAMNSGCTTDALFPGGSSQGAAIVGTVSANSATGKALTWSSSTECPEVVVTLNDSPADVIFDDDCSFVIENVAPADAVELRVEIPSLGISGTVELASVTDAELIEILVEVGDDSLSVSVKRRAKPAAGDELPPVVSDDDVTIELPAGTVAQDLTVDGDNFTLTGAAGDGCAAEGWTIINGAVAINGDNATFRNIKFVGSVQVSGGDPKFINCCFDGVLVSFGKSGDDHDEDEDDDDDHDSDDGDKDDGEHDDD